MIPKCQIQLCLRAARMPKRQLGVKYLSMNRQQPGKGSAALYWSAGRPCFDTHVTRPGDVQDVLVIR